MVYQIDYELGEKAGCSAQINIADRIFYTKHFANSVTRYFSSDQQGHVEKEISKAEFELWIGALADSETEAKQAINQLSAGKKY
jgi:hypothetical protein